MMRNEKQQGFVLLDHVIALVIMAILVPTMFICLFVVARESAVGVGKLTVNRDIGQAAEWISRDANSAQSFVMGEYPDYGTFYLLDTDDMQLEREVRYHYEESNEGLVRGTLMREESIDGDVVTDMMIVSGVDNYQDIVFDFDSELLLVRVQVQATQDAGSRMISGEGIIYGHLADYPWSWWWPYALAGGYDGLEMQASKNNIVGDVICDGQISITSQPSMSTEISGFLHSNYPYYHPQASDNVSISFTGQGTKIWGLASAYGEIDGENHALFNTPPNPNPYPGFGLRDAVAVPWADPPEASVNTTAKITLDWLLNNGYATQNGSDVTINSGVYSTTGNVNLSVTNINISGHVTFIAYDISIKGNTNAHFDLKAQDKTGLLFWAENDIQIEGSSSLFWGVSYAPQGEVEINGKAIGSEPALMSGPVIGKKLLLRGNGVSIER